MLVGIEKVLVEELAKKCQTHLVSLLSEGERGGEEGNNVINFPSRSQIPLKIENQKEKGAVCDGPRGSTMYIPSVIIISNAT